MMINKESNTSRNEGGMHVFSGWKWTETVVKILIIDQGNWSFLGMESSAVN